MGYCCHCIGVLEAEKQRAAEERAAEEKVAEETAVADAAGAVEGKADAAALQS